MKKHLFASLLLLILCVPALSGNTDTLSVMSYNLRFGELASMKEFSDAILSEAPDVVMLQECDWATWRERAPRQNGVKFINELAYNTGMFGLYGKSINYKGGYYGLGILSRYPIVSSKRILLPCDGKTEQRSLLIADIELPSGRTVTVACTHLEVSSEELRLNQVRFINRIARRNPHPVILAGDMNAQPDAPSMEMLRRKWKECSDRELTFSTNKPSIKIDYVYARPASSFEVLSYEVLRKHKLSDHFPIKCILTIN